MKKNFTLISIVAVIVIILSAWTSYLKSDIDYVDIDCPICGGCEVINFGDYDGETHCHCADCDAEFYLSED